jgi:capsid protein
MQRDRIQLIRDARDLEENHGLVASIQDRLCLYAFGRLSYHPLTGSDALNRKVSDLMWEWMQDVSEGPRTTLASYARLALRAMLRDGDIATDAPITSGPFRLRPYEADLIGGIIPYTRDDTDVSEVNGVIFRKSDGVPVAYVPYIRTLGDQYIRQEPIDANRVLMLLNPYRFFQYRGFSAYGPVINVARDLKEIEEACRIGVKVENFGAGFVMTPNGQFAGDPSAIFTDSSGTAPKSVETIEPGQIKYLPDGASVTMVKSERPSGNFQAYLDMLTRQLGLALKLPPGFLYSLAGMAGPAVRMDAQQAQRSIEALREHVREYLLDPVKNRFLLWCVSTGKIQDSEIAGYDLFAGKWGYPPALTIDVGREEQAAREAIKMGLRSEADYFDEAGLDYREQRAVMYAEAKERIAAAKRLSEEEKIPLARALDLLGLRSGQPSQDIPILTEDRTEGSLIERIGVGGAQGYIQLLVATARGEIPPEAARQSLVTLFGLDPESARRIISDNIAQAATNPEQ